MLLFRTYTYIVKKYRLVLTVRTPAFTGAVTSRLIELCNDHRAHVCLRVRVKNGNLNVMDNRIVCKDRPVIASQHPII